MSAECKNFFFPFPFFFFRVGSVVDDDASAYDDKNKFFQRVSRRCEHVVNVQTHKKLIKVEQCCHVAFFASTLVCAAAAVQLNQVGLCCVQKFRVRK